MTGRLIKAKIIWALALAAACALLFASPASAGTFTVNLDAATNGGLLSGCNLFGVWGSTNYFSYNAPCSGYQLGISTTGAVVPAGTRMGFEAVAPSGIAIIGSNVSVGLVDLNNGNQWGGGAYWNGGGDPWSGTGTFGFSDGPFLSDHWGVSLVCGASKCTKYAGMYFNTIQLTAAESQGPSLIAAGGNNLWYQGSHYVWNPPGDPWPVTLDASDPSGVCLLRVQLGPYSTSATAPFPYPLTTQWHQCPDWTGANEWPAIVDTNSVGPNYAGPVGLTVQAQNAAQVVSSVSETLQVDNVSPSVSFSTPNDANPSVWVNHAVTVASSASAGPSGVGGQSCSTDGGAAAGYSGPLTLDGDGAHTVTCTAWNNAVGPQGQPNTGSGSTVVHIDEAPPALSFEHQNPSAPTDVVVDASDGESGVAGGSLAIAPAGTQSWSSVPTSFDGQHLIGQINDAGLSGPYVVRATSCDNVGNCATSSETLQMPLRIAASSQVSFARIVAPAKVVHRRVLVGWRWRRIRINGRLERVRVGGHFKTVRIVIGRNALCATRRVRTGPHRWRVIRVCRRFNVRLVSHERVAYGHPVPMNGVLVSSDGVPIGGARVRILTAPDNGLSQFSQAAVVTTSADGGWSTVLPPGPSRLIEAVYDGSGRILPAASEVSVSVPARISLSVRPRALPWGGQITLSGHLDGGYIPPDGVALRLLIRYPGASRPNVILALRTDSAGRFVIQFRVPGQGSAESLPFWVSTTATESDFPFAPGSSRHLWVTFGGTTPAAGSGPPSHHHHGHRHHRRRR